MRRATTVLTCLVAALAAAVAWLTVAVRHLMASGVAYHDDVRGATRPSAAAVRQLLVDQNHWGVQSLFAVAAVALLVVATMVAWILAGRNPTREDRR